jgi:integrase
MLDVLLLSESEYPITQKATARYVANEWLRKGLSPKNNTTELTLQQYLCHFWDWDSSEYIQGKLARKQNSISKDYAKYNKKYVTTYFAGDIGKTLLRQVSTALLEKLILNLYNSGRYKERTLNAILQSIRVPLNEAVRLGLIEKNPALPIRSFTESRKEKGILTSKEIQDLLNIQWDSTRDYAAFCVTLTTGIRLGELLALRRESILQSSILIDRSWATGIGLKSTKTNKAREIPLPPSVKTLLLSELQDNPHRNSWVFWSPEKTTQPINDKAIEQGFYKALAKIGIEDDSSPSPSPSSRQGRNISFHSLRHSCNAFLRGVLPDEKVRMVTGHRSVELTNYYDHLTDLDRKAIIEAQEDRLLVLKKPTSPEPK